jgi:hypothetical protein
VGSGFRPIRIEIGRAILEPTNEEAFMTTLTHEPSAAPRRPAWIDARDMWASLAITAIWLSVLATALFGPDIRTFDAGGSNATIPSAVVVALFAMFATLGVAKHGLG